jgi:tetratricopeptide (TPR) repeat protein
MNFFAQQLYDYYLAYGKQIPPHVLTVLSKPLNTLTAEDINTYNQFVGPHQDKIRAALRERLEQQGSPVELWSQQVNPYYRPIVEELAVQIMGREHTAPLPATLVLRAPPPSAAAGKKGRLSGISLPDIPYRWVVVAVVVVALLAVGGWFFFSITAPSRMLKGIKGEVERGEYAVALRHIEEMEERYPEKAQTREAKNLKPAAALAYADELYASTMYEEAVRCYDIADADDDLEQAARAGRANAYLAWAGVLNEGADHANSYECCESALACAPEGYDTSAVMELRAQVLFSWGEALREGQDYYGAAARFEKCYREWPAGGLANRALENYVDMTVAACTGNPPPGKSASAGGSVQIRILNQSDYAFICYYSGPSTMCFDLAPREKKTIYVLPGVYNTAFVIERIGVAPAVGEDFTKPTSSYSWWELVLPSPQEVVPQGVTYDQITVRIEELKASLPPEVVECISRVSYEQTSGAGLLSDAMAEYDPMDDTIFFDPTVISPEELDTTIFHEWGHAYSDYYLDRGEKEEYMTIRDISPDIPWDDFDNYYLSVEEDFAEVFAVVFGNAQWNDYTWYGPVDNVDVLKEMILEAAD